MWFNGFQNGSRPSSWFFETQCCNGLKVKKPTLHHYTKFCKDRSNRGGDIVIFVISTIATTAILDFQKFEILTVSSL